MSKNGQIGKTENMEMLGKLRLKQLPKFYIANNYDYNFYYRNAYIYNIWYENS